MPRVLLSALKERSVHRPSGYMDDVLASGKLEGEYVVFTREAYQKLVSKYSHIKPYKELPTPTPAEMAGNFLKAFSNWTLAGFPVVSKNIFDERIAICKTCKFWNDEARAGLGKCNQPACGCTKIKFWLSTESCPIGKWKSEDGSNQSNISCNH